MFCDFLQQINYLPNVLDKINLYKHTKNNYLNCVLFCNTCARQRFCMKSLIYFHDFQNMHTHF